MIVELYPQIHERIITDQADNAWHICLSHWLCTCRLLSCHNHDQPLSAHQPALLWLSGVLFRGGQGSVQGFEGLVKHCMLISQGFIKMLGFGYIYVGLMMTLMKLWISHISNSDVISQVFELLMNCGDSWYKQRQCFAAIWAS